MPSHRVSMTSGPERPDAEKGDQRSPDAMDWNVEASTSLAFRTNNAGMMKPTARGHHIKAAEF
jgi:hypothetical protein